MSEVSATRLRAFAGELEVAAAQMRSTAELLEKDPENPDVREVVDDVVRRTPSLLNEGED
jgi:hypothetical protein